MGEMTPKQKLNAFDKIIDKFSSLTNYECFLEIVGSYAMYLHGMCEFEDVHDLDLVFHCSPAEFNKLNKFFYAMSISTNTAYSSINGTTRYPINLHGLDVCVFLTSTSEHIQYCGEDSSKEFNYIKGLSSLTYKHFANTYVKSVKDIIKAKLAYNRDKDIIQIKQYAKKMIDMIPIKESSKTNCTLGNVNEILVTFKMG